MGSCAHCESTETQRDQRISAELRRDEQQSTRVTSILLLGAPGCGKSTVIKQYRAQFGNPLTTREREEYKQLIHKQCIEQTHVALSSLEDLSFLFVAFIRNLERNSKSSKEERTLRIPVDIQRQIFLYYEGFDVFLSPHGIAAAAKLQHQYPTANALNVEIVAALKTLWEESAINVMYERRNVTKIEDTTSYFWDNIESINDDSYIPDQYDILRVYDHNNTRGIMETEVQQQLGAEWSTVRCIDLNGLQSEWWKWTRRFEQTWYYSNYCLFVASLSCYDEWVMDGDDEVNAMAYQLQLFNDVLNDPFLWGVGVILFLNKTDLFIDKITRVPLQTCPSFSDFGLDEDLSGCVEDVCDEALSFIKDKFYSQIPARRRLPVHCTCFLDADGNKELLCQVSRTKYHEMFKYQPLV